MSFLRGKSTFLIVAVVAMVAIRIAQIINRTRAHSREGTSENRGQAVMVDHDCLACHQAGSSFRAPILQGLVGKQRQFVDGTNVIADTNYIRESILEPRAKVVVGYQNIMPSYKEKLTPAEIEAIIESIK